MYFFILQYRKQLHACALIINGNVIILLRAVVHIKYEKLERRHQRQN